MALPIRRALLGLLRSEEGELGCYFNGKPLTQIAPVAVQDAVHGIPVSWWVTLAAQVIGVSVETAATLIGVSVCVPL